MIMITNQEREGTRYLDIETLLQFQLYVSMLFTTSSLMMLNGIYLVFKVTLSKYLLALHQQICIAADHLAPADARKR